MYVPRTRRSMFPYCTYTCIRHTHEGSSFLRIHSWQTCCLCHCHHFRPWQGYFAVWWVEVLHQQRLLLRACCCWHTVSLFIIPSEPTARHFSWTRRPFQTPRRLLVWPRCVGIQGNWSNYLLITSLQLLLSACLYPLDTSPLSPRVTSRSPASFMWWIRIWHVHTDSQSSDNSLCQNSIVNL